MFRPSNCSSFSNSLILWELILGKCTLNTAAAKFCFILWNHAYMVGRESDFWCSTSPLVVYKVLAKEYPNKEEVKIKPRLLHMSLLIVLVHLCEQTNFRGLEGNKSNK